VESFHVDVEADRASTYPKVITRARLKYVVTGDRISEASLVRAIDLSVKQYCPVHAMLKKAFPIAIEYSIFELGREAGSLPVKNGFYEPDSGTP
jgi:putative redox protein